MDFFSAQEQARKKSRRLVLWFVLAVMGIIALAYFFSALLFALLPHIWENRDFWVPPKGADDRGMFFVFIVLLILPSTVCEVWKDAKGLKKAVFFLLFVTLIFLWAYALFIIPPTSEYTFANFRLASVLLRWDGTLFFWVCLIAGGGIAIVSLYKIRQIAREGGVLIAEQLGGRRIMRGTNDPAERRFLNVMDEMAIAAGIPAPVAFVLDEEEGLNAFAAGFSMRDSVIAATRGLLETMNRDELQGVIGHEMGHIVHGDSRLNTQLIGILHGIYCFELIGLFMSKELEKPKGEDALGRLFVIPFLIASPILRLIGTMGFFFGRLIQSAVSREREYLADAAAVQFTRNPVGLASALNKLRASGSKIEHPEAFVASHLFFGTDGKPVSANSWASLLATHPPLTDRIRRIGKVFLPSPDPERPAKKEASQSPDSAAVEASQPRILAASPHAVLPAALPVVIAAGRIADEISPEGIAHAQNLLAHLPEPLQREASSLVGATGIVCGLFFSSQPDLRLQQEELLPPLALWLPTARELNQWLSSQPEQGAHHRLVWLDLALPTLREATESERQQLLVWARDLIRADGRVSASEFALYSLLLNALLPSVERRAYWLRPERLDSDIASLLALIAHAGHSDPKTAGAAYQAAIARSPAHAEMAFPDKSRLSLKTVSQAFSHLALTTPAYRKKILEACAIAAQHDGKITPVENELLRAFAQSLDCPAPLA